MNHKQAARKLAAIARKLDKLFYELQDIREAVPGWESVVYENVNRHLIRADQQAQNIAYRMKEHESWEAWDRADTARSNDLKMRIAGGEIDPV